jgi:hypothetical protein
MKKIILFIYIVELYLIKSDEIFNNTITILKTKLKEDFFRSTPFKTNKAINNYNLIIDIGSIYSMFVDNTITNYKSSSNNNIQTHFYIKPLSSSSPNTEISINTKGKLSNNKHKYYLLLSPNSFNSTFKYDGILGLAPISNNTHLFKYSYLHHLKHLKEISKLSFGYHYITENSIQLFFGITPTNNHYTIRNTTINTWNFQLEEINIYSNKKSHNELEAKIAINKIALIDPNVDGVIGPYREGYKIFMELMRIHNSRCFLYHIDSILYCACNVKPNDSDVPTIVFHVGNGLKVELLGRDLFKYDKKGGQTVWRSKLILKDDNMYWVIGESVLRNYDFVFDEENNKIWIEKNCNYFFKDDGSEDSGCFQSFSNSINRLGYEEMEYYPGIEIIEYKEFIVILLQCSIAVILFGIGFNVFIKYKKYINK